MSYEKIIGADFHKLHPMLQQRYNLKQGQTVRATGVMAIMQTKPVYLQPFYKMLSKFKFIVPQSGENIAFDLSYTLTHCDEKQAIYKWVRKFYFPNATYEFHTRMVIDWKTGIVKDYMGAPAVVNSHLRFDVTHDGQLMTRSQAVEAVVASAEIKVPTKLAPNALVVEGYDEKTQHYTIHLSIYHPIFGTMMSYAGKFRALKDPSLDVSW